MQAAWKGSGWTEKSFVSLLARFMSKKIGTDLNPSRLYQACELFANQYEGACQLSGNFKIQPVGAHLARKLDPLGAIPEQDRERFRIDTFRDNEGNYDRLFKFLDNNIIANHI